MDNFFSDREFDTLKSKKVPQSLEIGLFFCQIFIFSLYSFVLLWYNRYIYLYFL